MFSSYNVIKLNNVRPRNQRQQKINCFFLFFFGAFGSYDVKCTRIGKIKKIQLNLNLEFVVEFWR